MSSFDAPFFHSTWAAAIEINCTNYTENYTLNNRKKKFTIIFMIYQNYL